MVNRNGGEKLSQAASKLKNGCPEFSRAQGFFLAAVGSDDSKRWTTDLNGSGKYRGPLRASLLVPLPQQIGMRVTWRSAG